MDAIHGVTINKMAELNAKYSELKTKYGDQQGQTAFERYLQTEGLDLNVYAHAWNGWWARFSADPTGRLQAQYHMIEQQLMLQIHHGDVRDMSLDVQEGATLDQYVKIALEMGRPGADAEQIARANGLDGVDQWQRVNAAWSAAMGADTTGKIATQYGVLYQKYAGPAFQQQMFEQTAAAVASAHRQEVVDEPEEEITPEMVLDRLRSPRRREKWDAARRLAHLADLAGEDDRAPYMVCVPVLVEILERHDDDTVSDAEDAARRLLDLGQRNEEVRYAMSVCLNRAREHLDTLHAAFAPIQHRNVPERVTLQSRIQDYTSLVETLDGYLAEWEE
jgi:hypothetical protein